MKRMTRTQFLSIETFSLAQKGFLSTLRKHGSDAGIKLYTGSSQCVNPVQVDVCKHMLKKQIF